MRESVNIYGWQKYSTYMHPKQRQLQNGRQKAHDFSRRDHSLS